MPIQNDDLLAVVLGHEVLGGGDAEPMKETVKIPVETENSPTARLMSSCDLSCVFFVCGRSQLFRMFTFDCEELCWAFVSAPHHLWAES